jgi:Cys-tRNA synthase (O-phospho-L-seryl-tRNA:Cys-tRNA synthase)
MLGLLIGRLGMSKADALTLTAVEIAAIIKHGVQRETEEWKMTRWLATVLVNISGKSVKNNIKETDLIKFKDEQRNNGFADFLRAAKNEPIQ